MLEAATHLLDRNVSIEVTNDVGVTVTIDLFLVLLWLPLLESELQRGSHLGREALESSVGTKRESNSPWNVSS
jgi:hypothetical protein